MNLLNSLDHQIIYKSITCSNDAVFDEDVPTAGDMNPVGVRAWLWRGDVQVWNGDISASHEIYMDLLAVLHV